MSLQPSDLRQRKERLAAAIAEKRRREERARQANPRGGLLEFIRYFWRILEPVDPFVEGWVLECLCAHLEAITRSETVEIDGVERPFNRFLANVPPGFMKALDCNTPVLTTWGWKRHGDLRPGDFVFGPDGQPKRVLANTSPGLEESFEVEFDDGTIIVAGKGHLWEVERDYAYSGPGGTRIRKTEVVTTVDLIPQQTRENGRSYQRPDRIPLAAPLNLAPKRLLIDPYLLGAWLGDGATGSGVVYSSEQDIAHFKTLGYIAKTYPPGGTRKQDFHRIGIDDLQIKLRILGLLGNKHIPDDYLEASVAQRWELLRGLMDTDGCAGKEGQCSFTNKLQHLAEQVAQLATSLGLKAYVRSRYSVLNGKKYGPHYFVTFTAPDGAKVFNLGRKQERLRGNLNARSRVRYIADVRPVGLRTVNCITVEGQLYVAGKRFVTTHNSLTVNVFWPAWEWGPMELPHLRYVAFSYNSDLTERDNAKFRDLICSPAYREMWGHVFNVLGDGKVVVSNDKTGFKRATSFGGTGTGERGHRVLLDDPHKIKGTQESDDARKSVTNWVQEGMQNRLNDLTRDAIIIIMQRVHEEDTAGVVMKELGDEYCSLVIPMEYEGNRHFSHYTGWNGGQDPRTYDGELAWKDRYPPASLASFKRNNYLWSGQYQQNPVPRGGGLFQDEWWQVHEVVPKPNGGHKFVPDVTPIFVLASLDTAYSEKEENDYSALTVWVVHDNHVTKQRNILLADAWAKQLPNLSGPKVEQLPGESQAAYRRRAMAKWGLAEWVADTCDRRKVHRLIIENKNRAPDVIREIKKLFADRDWGVQSIDIKGDKWGRANAITDIFTDDMVSAPAEITDEGDVRWLEWADEAIKQISRFPRGGNDDILDSMTMAMKYLRDNGYAIRKDERRALDDARARKNVGAKREAIYPV